GASRSYIVFKEKILIDSPPIPVPVSSIDEAGDKSTPVSPVSPISPSKDISTKSSSSSSSSSSSTKLLYKTQQHMFPLFLPPKPSEREKSVIKQLRGEEKKRERKKREREKEKSLGNNSSSSSLSSVSDKGDESELIHASDDSSISFSSAIHVPSNKKEEFSLVFPVKVELPVQLSRDISGGIEGGVQDLFLEHNRSDLFLLRTPDKVGMKNSDHHTPEVFTVDCVFSEQRFTPRSFTLPSVPSVHSLQRAYYEWRASSRDKEEE
ncbi:hypothetical protein ADUPG1_001317, partial [Aduncisulcus paluster]